jgi:gliding motility-associated-like protein
VLFLLLLAGTRPALASHLLGGEMTYKYLDANGLTATPYRYEVTLTIYTNCNSSAQAPSPAAINIYNQATGARLAAPSVLRTYLSPTCITVAVPPGCTNTGATQQPYKINRYVTVVSLPAASSGYYAYFTSGNRNAGIANISMSDYEYLTLYATLAPPALANSSPVFAADALAVLCAADTTVVLNNAVDADGDRLEYSFGTPYSSPSYPSPFALPLSTVTYNTNFSNSRPLGAAPNSAKINASSGISKFYATSVGAQYAVAIDVKEYRTIGGVEVLIGTTRRDVQLIVGTCPATAPPTLPTAAIMPRSYTIEAGSTLTIPLAGTQPASHPLTLTATSVLLDGSGGYNATFAGNAGTLTYAGSPVGAYALAGTTGGTVAGAFVFSPTCAQARATPYDVTLLLQDVGCAGKITSEVLRIMVVKSTGPTNITGSLNVCGLNAAQTYTATGGTAPSVSWTVTGGTIVGSATANPVTVSWPTAGAGTITAQGITQYGCLVDAVTRNVLVSPSPVLPVTGNLTICQGSSTTLSVAGGGSASYLLTGGGTTVLVTNPFVVSPTQTTTYTISPAVVVANGCPARAQVTVAVVPRPVADAGAAASLCAGGTAQLGAAAVAGLAYSWSPNTGLSSPTAANPTVTLTNTTSAAITQTYTLTVTSAAGCSATGTVAVTVNPTPVANAGVAVALCAGGTGQLGAAAVAGLSYSWSPNTGLSSSTAANPTVTLPNTTSAPITQTYTLTVSGAGGCTATGTVLVTVQPAVTPGTIGADQTVCAGSVPAMLTSTAAAGGGAGTYAYQWESSLDNTTWAALAGATSPTCTPGPVAATTYFRRRAVAGTCGAVYSNVVAVTAQPLLVPAVALAVQPAQCAGLPFTFTPTATNAGILPTYQWFVNGVAVATDPSYASATLANGDLVRVVLTPTAGFCTSGPAMATVRVSLAPAPLSALAIAATSALPACPGAPITFGLGTAANAGTNPQYQWQVDGTNVPSATGLGFVSATLRDGQVVTLVMRSTNACGQPTTATSNAVRVAINQPAQLSAGPDKTIMEGETVVLEGTAAGSYPVSWSPSQTLTFVAGNQLRPVAAPLATTTYTLAAGAGVCGSSSTVTVTVLPRVRIPNAFSPNGDRNDDTWQIDNLEAYPSSRVIVFNRWGAKIFEAANYSRGSEWNGTINGQPAPFGTYYYLITLGNGKSYTGPITVVN